MVDTTDAVLELEDYIAIEKRKLSNDLEWASLLTERMFEPSGGRLLRQAYVEWKLGNLSNAGVALIRILEEHLKEVAQREYETYELGQPSEFDERPRKRPQDGLDSVRHATPYPHYPGTPTCRQRGYGHVLDRPPSIHVRVEARTFGAEMTDDTPPNLEKYAAEMYDLLCLIEMYPEDAWLDQLNNFLERVRSGRDRD